MDLSAAAHPVLTATLLGAFALYGVALLLAILRPVLARPALWAGLLVHLFALCGRGWLIGFLPLSNKMESFSAAAFAMALVPAVAWRPARAYPIPQLLIGCAFAAAACALPLDLAFPNPILRTLWYPLHVPVAFLTFALWTAAAAAGLAWLVDRRAAWLEVLDRMVIRAFSAWTWAMITGGIWGVVSWGSYFMWDQKMIWSVIFWLHAATACHVAFTPSLAHRSWVRLAFVWVGLLWVFIAYVGASYFMGESAHAF